MAPELLKHKGPQFPPFSKKTDIYSLGVLLWELSSGCPPFKDDDENFLQLSIVSINRREQRMSDTPSGYHELYTACWNEKPEERPTIEIVHDKLFKNIKNIKGNLMLNFYNFL